MQNHKTPVHLAAHLGHVEVLRVLIKGYHANKMVQAMVNFKVYAIVKFVYTYCSTYCYCVYTVITVWVCQNGRVPLHYAADGGRIEAIRALVTEFNCPPDCRDNVSDDLA